MIDSAFGFGGVFCALAGHMKPNSEILALLLAVGTGRKQRQLNIVLKQTGCMRLAVNQE